MKTYHKQLGAISQKLLLVLVIAISLLGFSLDSSAQDVSLGNDLDKINQAMVLKLNDRNLDILIPKVEIATLQNKGDASFNQLVYATGKNGGFYLYAGNIWEKQKISEVFEIINFNMRLGNNSENAFIIFADSQSPSKALDYNAYVKEVYKDFGVENSNNGMAINLLDE